MPGPSGTPLAVGWILPFSFSYEMMTEIALLDEPLCDLPYSSSRGSLFGYYHPTMIDDCFLSHYPHSSLYQLVLTYLATDL